MGSELKEKEQKRTCSIVLQLSDKDFMKNDKICLFDQETKQQIEFKHIEHFSNHLQESEKQEVMCQQYFEQSKQFQQGPDEIQIHFLSSANLQFIFSMKFPLPPNTEVYFLDLLKQEEFKKQISQNQSKISEVQVSNACINNFGIQVFFKLSFIKFINFLHEYSTTFVTCILVNCIKKSEFLENWENKIHDLRYILKILYLESVNINIVPLNRLIEELEKISKNEKDLNNLVNTINKIKQLEPWREIVKMLEEFCIQSSTFQTSLQFLRIRFLINSKQSPSNLIKRFIYSGTEPNLSDIFKREYQHDKLISYEEMITLIQEQYLRVEEGQALKYIEENLEMLQDLLNYNEVDKNDFILKIIIMLIQKCFKSKNGVQSSIFIKDQLPLFQQFGLESEKIEQIIGLQKKLVNLNLETLTDIEQKEFTCIIEQKKLNFDECLILLKKSKTFFKLENQGFVELIDFLVNDLINQTSIDTQNFDKILMIRDLILTFSQFDLTQLSEQRLIAQILYSLNWIQILQYQTSKNFRQEEKKIFKQYQENIERKTSWMKGLGQIILTSKNFTKEVQSIVKENVEEFISHRFLKFKHLNEHIEFLQSFKDLSKELKTILLSIPIFIKGTSKTFEEKYGLTEENGIQVILYSASEISLLLELFSQNNFFKEENIYKTIFRLMNQCNKPEQLMWKDYKFILDESELFNQIMKSLSIKVEEKKNLKQFSEQLSNFQSYLNILQVFGASDYDEKQSLIQELDKEESLKKKVSEIMGIINLSNNENYNDILQISTTLFKLQLFYKIIQQDNLRNQNFPTSSQVEEIIITQVIPRIVGICEQITNKQALINEEEFKSQIDLLKQIDPKINTNYLYVMNKYFIDFSMKDCDKESKLLITLMKKISTTNFSELSIMEFLEQGKDQVQSLNLIEKLIEYTSNYKFIDSTISLKGDISIIHEKQNKYTKQEFIKDSAKIHVKVIELHNQIMTENYFPDFQNIFNKFITALKEISSVYQLYLEFENEDLTWILQIDENDIALRTKDFLNLKPQFFQLKQSIEVKKDIISYFINIIKIFWPDGMPKGIDQIRDISKYCEQIKDRIIEEKQQPSEGSIKRLGKLILDSSIEIILIDSQKIISKQNDDDKTIIYYQIVFIQHNKDKEDVSLQEDQIQEMLQRLDLVGEDQLKKAFDKQQDKLDEFQNNKAQFTELFKILTHLGKTLDQFIQLGSLSDIITKLTVNLKNNNCLQISQQIKKFTVNQENLLDFWKNCIKEERKNFQTNIKILISQIILVFINSQK